VELAGNPALTLFSQMIIEIVGRHHKATLLGAPGKRDEFAKVGCEHHAHLIELIADRRAEEAEAFWRFHIDGAAERALRFLGPKTLVDLY
jgi:DNA-binding GntR family transcriptional regulator